MWHEPAIADDLSWLLNEAQTTADRHAIFIWIFPELMDHIVNTLLEAS